MNELSEAANTLSKLLETALMDNKVLSMNLESKEQQMKYLENQLKEVKTKLENKNEH